MAWAITEIILPSRRLAGVRAFVRVGRGGCKAFGVQAWHRAIGCWCDESCESARVSMPFAKSQAAASLVAFELDFNACFGGER